MLSRICLLLALMAVPLVCGYCVYNHSAHIAMAIHSHVASELQNASIAGVNVAADGRDIVLTGNVPSEQIKNKAGYVARLASGVRVVDNLLVVQAKTEPALPDAKTVQTSINKILLDKKIEFTTGRDVLLPQSIPVLEEVLQVLKQAPQLAVSIEGYTDSIGDPDFNRDLSKARAQAVADWFKSKGIAENRLTAQGFGSDKPIAPNSTAAGRYANRRVEISAH